LKSAYTVVDEISQVRPPAIRHPSYPFTCLGHDAAVSRSQEDGGGRGKAIEFELVGLAKN